MKTQKSAEQLWGEYMGKYELQDEKRRKRIDSTLRFVYIFLSIATLGIFVVVSGFINDVICNNPE